MLVTLHLRHKRTKVTSVCLFVRLSVVSVRDVRPLDGRSAMLRRNLRGMRGKNAGSKTVAEMSRQCENDNLE